MDFRKEVTNDEFYNAYKIIDNKNIINKVTSKYVNSLTFDERYACGLLGLWKTLQNHIDGKGNKFTTSLYTHTKWICLNEIRSKNKKSVKTVSINNMDIIAEDENNEIVNDILSVLKEEEKKLITQFYLENRTLVEIGKLNGYSKETARQRIKRAVKKLKKVYL